MRRLRPVPEFVSSGDYMADYRRHTDQRVKHDPHEAIGGFWEEVGQLQFDFLKAEGLQPEHRLLDVGCGTLRGGRHFINYLHGGNYTGTEMSEEAVKQAKELIRREGLKRKHPHIVHVPDGNFRFEDLWPYDFILAPSVFTHLKEPLIEECFLNIGKVMEPGARFYFTFLDPAEFTDTVKDFAYPFGFFAELGRKYGLGVEDVSERYRHPRGQKMALACHAAP